MESTALMKRPCGCDGRLNQKVCGRLPHSHFNRHQDQATTLLLLYKPPPHLLIAYTACH